MGQAKLLGYVIDQVATGAPKEFQVLHGDPAEQERQVLEKLRERVSSRAADRFIALIRDAREDFILINSETRRIEGDGE
jgi:hypothetical protein